MAREFDVAVIGGGPGGYMAAERAAEGGLSAVVIEEKAMGGTCLNEGCVPTKTLLYSAKLYRHASESEAFGVHAEAVSFDHARVMKRKAKVVKTLVAGVEYTMKNLSVPIIRERGVIRGRQDGRFLIGAGDEEILCSKLILAAGSETAIPPLPGIKEGLESGFVVTSREILQSETLPQELVVIGGGVIGLEMACYYASVGSHVTVIEMLPKIAGTTDKEICDLLMKEYKKRGMVFKLGCRVLEITGHSVLFEEAGEQKEIACDRVLLSVGRAPATGGLGLENLGIEMNRRAIAVNEYLETSVPGVYAVGDCNGKLMLAHTAYREAEAAVHHILGIDDPVRYETVPAVIYTDPEVASVGETKESAESKGLSVREIKLPLRFSGRYLAETERGEGFLKLVVEEGTRKVLGCHIIGPYASEIIVSAVMMIDLELTAGRMERIVFPHPTVGEVLREAVFRI